MNFDPSPQMNFKPTGTGPRMNFAPSNHGTPAHQPMPGVHLGPPISTQFGRSIDSLASLPAPPARGGGGGASLLLPFKIRDISPDEETPTIKVVFGTVMDVTPSNVETDLEPGDDAINTIYLEVTINAAGQVTAAAVTVSTGPLPTNDTYAAYILIGYVTVAAGVITLINQSLYFSQGFKACDRDTADPETTPGSYQFFVR